MRRRKWIPPVLLLVAGTLLIGAAVQIGSMTSKADGVVATLGMLGVGSIIAGTMWSLAGLDDLLTALDKEDDQ